MNTEMYEDDDPDTKRIPKQNSNSSQLSHIIQNLLSEIQYQYFSDPHHSQNTLTNMPNSLSPDSDEFPHTNALTQTPIKPISTQSLPRFDPSFLLMVKHGYTWLKQIQKPYNFNPFIKTNFFLYTYNKKSNF